MAAFKGREAEKDTADLPININKVANDSEEGGIVNRSPPIEREVYLPSYSAECLSDWPNCPLIFIFK